MLGFSGHLVLLNWLGSLVDVELPRASAWPALQGVAMGIVLLLGFALPLILPLTRVPPVHVIRREIGDARHVTYAVYGVDVLLFTALLIVAAGELKLGGIVAGGFTAGLSCCSARTQPRGHRLAVCARVAGTAQRIERAADHGARHRPMCLLLIGMTRNDLIKGWRDAMPLDAPNQFLIDI